MAKVIWQAREFRIVKSDRGYFVEKDRVDKMGDQAWRPVAELVHGHGAESWVAELMTWLEANYKVDAADAADAANVDTL